jgi:fumarate hydratase class II
MPPTNRVEHDSMGALEVPANALWGAQTQRAVHNFPGTGLRTVLGHRGAELRGVVKTDPKALTEGGVHGAGSAA